MRSRITQAERDNLLRVKGLPCAVCGLPGPSYAHHVDTGMGRRKDHGKVIPLCYNHHQGPEGIHTLGKKEWRRRYGDERDKT